MLDNIQASKSKRVTWSWLRLEGVSFTILPFEDQDSALCDYAGLLSSVKRGVLLARRVEYEYKYSGYSFTVKPRTIMSIDLNFDNITLAVLTLDDRLVKLKRFKTPHRKILTHRIWVEGIQRNYPRSWRFIKGVRKAIDRHGERIKNISWDYAYKMGGMVALTFRHRSLIILEDLEKLRENNKKSRFCIEYEARERSIEVVKVNPRGTSSKCPRCGKKLHEIRA